MLALIAWSWWLIAGWVLRPLSATARDGPPPRPAQPRPAHPAASGPDPYKELADAIDDALDRLAAGYESQRRFAANASHELRTPLAVQRLLTEVAMEDPDAGQDLRRLGAQLLRTNERNENLIEGLLVLAESDRGLQGKVPVRLDELAGEVVDAHQELAAKHQVTLRPKLSETTVPCDPVLIERLIANLVSNAIRYNEPGGWVEVEVTGRPASMVVRNTGQPVPAEAVPDAVRAVQAARRGPGTAAGAAASASAWPSSARSCSPTRARSVPAPGQAAAWRSRSPFRRMPQPRRRPARLYGRRCPGR